MRGRETDWGKHQTPTSGLYMCVHKLVSTYAYISKTQRKLKFYINNQSLNYCKAAGCQFKFKN